MTSTASTIWTEKYRPKRFSDIIGQQECVKKVEAFVRSKNLPHLLFTGPPGVGKTTLSLVIAHELFGDGWSSNLLELNASDERGIDVVRHKVKDFARTRAIGDVPFKIIYLDECDALTKEAQQALRRTMENYTQTTRFILSANYSSKIIDPIQSRCAIFRFKPLADDEIVRLIERIAVDEKLAIANEAKAALVDVCRGDCRRVSNILQSCSVISKEIDHKLVFSMASVAEPKDIRSVLDLAVAGKFLESRSKLLETMQTYGLSGIDAIKQMQSEIVRLDIGPQKKMQIISYCGEAEFRLTEGSDEFIQLEAFLANLALLGK